MYPPVFTKDASSVEAAVRSLYAEMFPHGETAFVARAFSWAADCFEGRYADYQAIDARYHDFEHTLQVTLCLGRLVQALHRAHVEPVLDEAKYQLVLLSILLHDTGYLKKRGDHSGTGAKYTQVHVARSAEFAKRLLAEKGYSPAQIHSVGNMIRCTGVNADMKAIPFTADWEKTLGAALATADLLGQMAADDYVEKLPILFEEFAESARYQTGDPKATGMFSSVQDLINKTPAFWEKYVVSKINKDFGGLYRYMSDPFPDGPNWYIQKIEANIERLKQSAVAVVA